MSLTKLKEKQKEVQDNFNERVAAVEAQLEPTFYKYRNIAEIMLKHNQLPQIPKEFKDDIAYRKDELALRIEYCHAKGFPEIFANDLQNISGRLGIGVDTAASLFKQAYPHSQFKLIRSTDTEHIMKARASPNEDWQDFKFTIIDAQKLHLLEKNNPHWEGYSGRQKMLAKSNFKNSFYIMDRTVLNGMSIEEEGLSDEVILPTVPIIHHAEVTLAENPEVIQSQPISNPSPEPALEPVEEVVEAVVELGDSKQIEESVKTEIVNPKELREELMPYKAVEHEAEVILNTKPFTSEEIAQIRADKIKEMPPSPDAEPEVVEEVEEVPIEEPKRKEKKSKKPMKDTLKPDTSFLNKTPLKESTPVELRKPFGMSQLTINDPKYHTPEIYEMIGDDWFTSFTKGEVKGDLWADANLTVYQMLVKEYDEKAAVKIDAKYKEFLKESNDSEKLIVCYHDALTAIENPIPLNILDFKYMEKMIFIIEILKTFKSTKTNTDEIREEFFKWVTDKNQGNSKEALWAWKYMTARKML
jgi:hypothetical protein